MSLPPSRPHPPASAQPQSQFLLPPASPPAVKRTAGSYFHYALWKTLMQQAARHRYWLKGGAIAYGITGCLLISSFMGVAAASLWPAIAQVLIDSLQRWLPDLTAPISAVVTQMRTDWRLDHRWWLFLGSTTLSLALWLKVVGLTQQIIRSDGDLASHLIPTLRQRLITALVAVITAALTLLATGVVLLTLPAGLQSGAAVSILGLLRYLLAQGLRWSLAASTIALCYGLLYRSSQKSSARTLPVLPGTVFATLLWLLVSIFLKRHLNTLANHHWLFSTGSTLTLGLLGLYGCTLGLLLGGQYNKLVNRYFPTVRSRSVHPPQPPPSFDSFTIQKRRYR